MRSINTDKLLQLQIESSPEIRFISEPLSENDILYLEDIFLKSGTHRIQVKDVQSGRKLLYQFLKLFSVYHDLACLSVDNAQLESYIIDVYQELLNGSYIDQFGSYRLEEYFYNQFFVDFLWIELTKDLEECDWYQQFEEKIHYVQIPKHIPVIMLSYESAT